MFTTRSILGKTIRLPEERWVHIVERHPEMAGSMEDVLLAVAMPDFALMGGDDELLAATYHFQEKLLVVVYREDENDGFIITAWFTRKTDKLLKRKILWQK